ncbi:MAG TPA: tetratricopeptide repeat protein, partial [Anaeromyxobacteraceae bacterium]|nr:tetratricopeptide repeat protein [Anaeromyxobacteraceae bacterium]
ALGLRPQDATARAGLGWIAFRHDDPEGAQAWFKEALAIDPSLAVAREGIEALERSPSGTVHGILGTYGGAQLIVGGDRLTSAWMQVIAFDLRIANHFTMAGTYRHLGTVDSPDGSQASQEEGHLALGYSGAIVDMRLLAGGVGCRNGNQDSRDALAFGTQLKLRSKVEITLAAVYSLYVDGDVAQLDSGLSIPLSPWVALSGGSRVQLTPRGTRLVGMVEMRVHRAKWWLGLGGSYGSQDRMVDLETLSIYNTLALIHWSAHVRAGFPIAGPFGGYASYDLEDRGALEGFPSWSATSHLLSAGFTFWL